jgi:aminoglycoside phosphotransferase (APT) family kinase protein
MEEGEMTEEMVTDVQRSARDMTALGERLEAWLGQQVGGSAELGEVEVPSSNGMSSETVLFDATWDGERRRLVARLAPEATAVPVFPSYDLERQARVMREVRDACDVPIPEVYWSEPDPAPLGTPFFVMGRVDGRVPPDVMPYNFDSWVSQASPEQRRHLQDSSIEVLARMHAIDSPEARFDFLDAPHEGATAMRRQVADQAAYYEWAREGLRVPLIERTFRWLDDNWPDDEGDAVMCWGDARIGNMMFGDDFAPVAVLDWEMAALAPREVDLAWFAYLHRFFEDLAAKFGAPGLPDFLRLDDVASSYERAAGVTPRHLRWFTVYAALRYAIVSVRTTKRGVHFGQGEMPDDLDDLIMHRAGLEDLLAGGGGPGLEG